MKKGEIFLAIALFLITTTVSANTAPIIGEIEQEIVVCESSSLYSSFDVTDAEGGPLTVLISPSGPFFIRSVQSNSATTPVEIYSANLTKEQSNKIYNEIILVSDGQLVDTKEIKITVLERNNPPQIKPIGAKTIVLDRNDTFGEQVIIDDIESGNQSQSSFTFEVAALSSSIPVEIDDLGMIKFSPTQENLGIHEIQVCATDSGVEDLENKIGFCGEGDIRETSCIRFKAVVVEENNAPTILLYNSSNSSWRFGGTDKIDFEVYKFDPDGIIPDTHWYVDGILKKIDSGNAADKFTYIFGCNIWGAHTVEARVTDSLLMDFVSWKFDLIKIPCSEENSIGERIGKENCEESWGCYDWNICQSLSQSEEIGIVSFQDKQNIEEKCSVRGFDAETCGFQIRGCVDVNACDSIGEKPVEIQECSFSLDSSCSDGIKNCHDESCELAVDCGGPCDDCLTCTDGIKNQGEEGIDCGGPCFRNCPKREISEAEKSFNLKLLIVFLLLFMLALVQIVRIIKTKEELEKPFEKGGKEKNEKR